MDRVEDRLHRLLNGETPPTYHISLPIHQPPTTGNYGGCRVGQGSEFSLFYHSSFVIPAGSLWATLGHLSRCESLLIGHTMPRGTRRVGTAELQLAQTSYSRSTTWEVEPIPQSRFSCLILNFLAPTVNSLPRSRRPESARPSFTALHGPPDPLSQLPYRSRAASLGLPAGHAAARRRRRLLRYRPGDDGVIADSFTRYRRPSHNPHLFASLPPFFCGGLGFMPCALSTTFNVVVPDPRVPSRVDLFWPLTHNLPLLIMGPGKHPPA